MKSLFTTIGILSIYGSVLAQSTNFTVYVINPNNCAYTFAANWYEQGTFTGGPVNWNSVDTSSAFQDVWSATVPSSTMTDSMTICVIPAAPCSCPMACITQAVNPGAYTLQLCSNVGINEITQEHNFSVYPNPANSQINVKVNKTLLGSNYTIYDKTGQILLNGKVNSENTIIELGELSGGIYLFSLGENSRQTFHLIKD